MTMSDAIQPILSPNGWAYASTDAMQIGDPGRFHTLFGRDSLIFALQVMPERPDVARATLRALASMQGSRHDAEIDEEPGKILHEYWPQAPSWLIADGWPTRNGGISYYGTSDATSWFLIVLAALADGALNQELRDARRVAVAWLEHALARGGGLVRSGPRLFAGGLSQQGWRDALNPTGEGGDGGGIVRLDGSTPTSPVADADSQAAAVAALDAMSALEPDRSEHYASLAAALRRRISDVYAPNVLALEGDDIPVEGAGSQLGWLLWANALVGSAAREAALRCIQPDVLTPYGLRTLSGHHPQFRVDGYHRGAVWPFDTWLGWGGLRAAGFSEAADEVRRGVLTAVQRLGGFPELYAVGRGGGLKPIPFANRVQAWTIGATWALTAMWDGRGPARST